MTPVSRVWVEGRRWLLAGRVSKLMARMGTGQHAARPPPDPLPRLAGCNGGYGSPKHMEQQPDAGRDWSLPSLPRDAECLRCLGTATSNAPSEHVPNLCFMSTREAHSHKDSRAGGREPSLAWLVPMPRDPRLCPSEAGQGRGVCTTRTGPGVTRLSPVPGGHCGRTPNHTPSQQYKVKGETCSKSTLFYSGRVSAPSSPLQSYPPLMCSPHPPSLPSLSRWFPRRRCFAPAPLTSLPRNTEVGGGWGSPSMQHHPPISPCWGGLQFCCSPFTPISPLTSSTARTHPSPSSAVPGVSLYPQPEGEEHAG